MTAVLYHEISDKKGMQVEPEVNQEVLVQLKDMGFGHDRSVRAVRHEASPHTPLHYFNSLRSFRS